MKNNLIHRFAEKSIVLLIAMTACFTLSAQTLTVNLKAFHNSSATATSKITYYLTPSNGWFNGISQVTNTVLVNKTTGATVYSSTATSSNRFGTIPTTLAPAQYELTITIQTYNNAQSKIINVAGVSAFWIGNKVMWENCFDMEPGISQYSMKRSKTTSGQTYSYAQSFNQLPAATYGWVEMQKLTSNMNDSRVYMVVEPLSDPRTFTPTSNVSYIEFYRNSSGVSGINVRYKQTNGVYTNQAINTGATNRIRFIRNANNTCILQVNDSTAAKFTFPSTISGALKVTLLSKQLNDQADNIVTSYAYPSSNYPISTDFESANTSNAGMGAFTTRIAPLSGFSSPYNYFITETPMDDMKAIYKYLKDSIYTQGVDSTTFFQGAVAGTSNISQLLPSGTYYSSVFDSKGVRIFTNRHDLIGTYSFNQRNQIENEYNEFLSTSPDAYATLNTYLTEANRATLTYNFPNTAPDQIVGVIDENDPITGGTSWYAKIKYGFYIQNGLYQTIVNGALSSTASINANEPCQLIFENGNVYFYKNSVLVRTETAPTTYAYKSGAYCKSWGTLINFMPSGVSFRPYKLGITVTDNACDKNSGDLALTFSGFHGQSVSGVNFSLKNITSDPANPTNVYTNITTNTTYGDLASGVYLLEGQLTVGGNTYTNIRRVIYVGSKLSWDPYVNIQSWSSNNTMNVVSTSSVSNFSPAKAISTNILIASTPASPSSGWVVFQYRPNPSFGFNQLNRRCTFSLSDAPLLGYPQGYSAHMPVVHFIWGLPVSATTIPSSGPVQFSIMNGYSPGVPMMVYRKTNNDVVYRQNYSPGSPYGVLRTVTNYTSGRWKPDVFTNLSSNGFIDVFSNFQCVTPSTTQFAKLEYEMDGYYHVMKNGKLNFVFNQEYDTQSQLKFNIYNGHDVIIKNQSNYLSQQVTHGDNYISLDLTGTDSCIGQGMFYLEVINDKNEKSYLRFYNEYSNCTPSLPQNPGDLQGQ